MYERATWLAVIVAAVCLPCLGGPVYINGTGNSGGNNPFSYSGVFVAQDFVLVGDTLLTGLSFNAYTTGSTVPISAVNVQIYGDSGGTVGSQLFSGAFLVSSEAVTGTEGVYTLKDYFVDLPGWYLTAGHYWLGLRVDPAQEDMHWTIPGSLPLGYGSYQGDAAGDPESYVSYTWEHSFTLFDGEGAAIPEPSTVALSLAGAGLIGLLSRRRR